METKILDGRAMNAQIKEELKPRIAALKEKGIIPGLAVIIIGEDPASMVYVRNKERTSRRMGMMSKVIRLPEDVSQAELERNVDELNADEMIHGILIQSPIPKHLNETEAFQRVLPEKDIDGFNAINIGNLSLGLTGFVPATPRGCIEILKRSDIEIKGKNAVVIGRSNIVGKPVAALLTANDATVTIAHSKTRNLPEITRNADILVVAIGQPKYITADMIKPGAVVIDVGMNRLPDGSLCGDVDYDEAINVAGRITPVPGGVGQLTMAMLLVNTVDAAEKYANTL